MDDDRLKIAMLSAHSCPVGDLGARDTGGMSVYIREIARELGEQGHYVDVYTRSHDPSDPQIVELGSRARLIHLKAGQEETIHKLNEDESLVSVKRKVFGKGGKMNILEADFAYSGRIYFQTDAGSKIKIVAIGTKNTQEKDITYLEGIR